MIAAEFNVLSEVLKQRSGLTLTEDKGYLLESRLTPILRKRDFKTLGDLVAAVKKADDESLLVEVTEVMTTNESFFFRDTRPFDQFKDELLPTLMQNRGSSKTIRIWSAACSNGQEPYSLAMILREQAEKLAGWRIEIIATDLATGVLAKARAGIYSQFEVQRGLPIKFLVKYFKETGQGWEIDSSIRAMVQFKEFNLLDSMVSLGNFDLVFCRNVLIYFDQATKADVLERICHQMSGDGYLCLGGAETVLGITERFKPAQGQRGVYEIVPGEKRAAS